MSEETGIIVMSLEEFRRRAIPSAGLDKGSVVPYDIQLRANDEALLNGCVYNVKTNSDNVTLTYLKDIDVTIN